MADSFETALNDLEREGNSKPHINMLTILAGDNQARHGQIIHAIEYKLGHAQGTALPFFYLIDSILKNIGGPYVKTVEQRISKMVMHSYTNFVRDRPKIKKTRLTWESFKGRPIFNPSVLQHLDDIMRKVDMEDSGGNRMRPPDHDPRDNRMAKRRRPNQPQVMDPRARMGPNSRMADPRWAREHVAPAHHPLNAAPTSRFDDPDVIALQEAERALNSNRLDPVQRRELERTVRELRDALNRRERPMPDMRQDYPRHQQWDEQGGRYDYPSIQSDPQTYPHQQAYQQQPPDPGDRNRLVPTHDVVLDPRARPAAASNFQPSAGGPNVNVHAAPHEQGYRPPPIETPPPAGFRKPSNSVVSPGAVFNDLASLGLLNGILGSDNADPVPTQNEPPSKSGQKLESIPEIELEYSSLIVKHPAVFDALMPLDSFQCKTCGLRFRKSAELDFNDHLDWHFKKNQEKRDTSEKKKSISRMWYISRHEWTNYTDATTREERSKSDAFEKSQKSEANEVDQVQEETSVMIQKDSDGIDEKGFCGICKEPLETYFHDDDGEDEWRFKNAVRRDGFLYHFTCWKDAEQNGNLPSPGAPASPLLSSQYVEIPGLSSGGGGESSVPHDPKII